MGCEGKKRLWMMIVMMMGFQVYGCLKRERNALLLIKQNSLMPSFWSDEVTLKTSDDCCDWHGITCDKSKYIVSINLDCKQSKLEWDLNASLFLPFHHLRKLNLSSGCSIQSWIEHEGSVKLSSKLTKLEELNLGYNMLKNTIFLQLKGFQSLKRLYLSGNKLGGTILLHEIETVSKNLEELDLSSNQITSILDNDGCIKNYNPQNYQAYGNNTSCFGRLSSSLKLLDISDNQFVGEIPLWIQNLTSLEILDLSYNQLTGNVNLSPIIHLHSLTLLEISYNYFQIPITFLSFSNHTKLNYFFGDSNQVVQVSNVDDVQTFTLRLQAISLSGCALSMYPNILYHQEHLRFIDLSNNKIDAEFPSWLLENNSRLETLILSNNSLFGPLHLPFLTPIRSMSQIFIDRNKIQGLIPANTGIVFPKLVELDLSNNELKGDIPSSFSELKSLVVLQLSNNNLSGGMQNLSKNSVNMSIIDLSNNDYKQEISSFYHFEFLGILNLKGNKFFGSLKTMMFGPNIGILVLSNNFLEGHVPEDIGNLSTLHLLDLSFNKFNGPLPKFSIMPYLSYLYLNNNKFSGHIHDKLCKSCVNLLQIDISNNVLTGHIPPSIGNFTSLNTLVMRSNLFDGEIPIELCQLFNLYILDLSSNALHGSIPTCLGHITFSWQKQQLTGIFITISLLQKSSTRVDTLISSRTYDKHGQYLMHIELTLKSITYNYDGEMVVNLCGIDLSCNKLTSHIPHELGNLSDLITLNVSHNKLLGPIPVSFSNLKNIESLDLSYNQLNGSIPNALTTLNTLESFKVAYNNLSGRIPFEAQLSTFDASNYQGNPFLCGNPLTKKCTTSKSHSSSTNVSEDENEDEKWIDMETFYVTFTISSIIMFLAVVIIMLINPYWRNAWFYILKACITSFYYFLKDCIRKIKRVKCLM